MLLGDARTMDERGLDIEKTKHRVLYGKRICDERTANCREARMAAFGRGQIRKSWWRLTIDRRFTVQEIVLQLQFADQIRVFTVKVNEHAYRARVTLLSALAHTGKLQALMDC